MKTFFLTALVTVFSLSATAEQNPRTEFRTAVEKYFAAFNAEHPATCSTWNYGEGIKTQTLNFEISDNSGEYPDAFFIYFKTGTDIWFSTLIAYEGYHGHELGRLTVTSDQTATTYSHSFFGAYTDKTKAVAGTDGSIKFTYHKYYQGQAVRAVVCEVLPGQTE